MIKFSNSYRISPPMMCFIIQLWLVFCWEEPFSTRQFSLNHLLLKIILFYLIPSSPEKKRLLTVFSRTHTISHKYITKNWEKKLGIHTKGKTEKASENLDSWEPCILLHSKGALEFKKNYSESLWNSLCFLTLHKTAPPLWLSPSFELYA